MDAVASFTMRILGLCNTARARQRSWRWRKEKEEIGSLRAIKGDSVELEVEGMMFT